jgi:hypothetical protein
MLTELAIPTEQSARAYQAIRASLVSSALARREHQRRFRRLLDRYLDACDEFLGAALSLGRVEAKVAELEDAVARIETQVARLRSLPGMRRMALQRNREIGSFWTQAVHDRSQNMIGALEEGATELRKCVSAKRAIGDDGRELRLRMLDSLLEHGDEAEQAESWEHLRRALNENRPSGRELYPPE